MTENQQHLDTLHEIRSLMERSSRFISLSGLSGVFAGLFALGGIGFAYYKLEINPFIKSSYLNIAGRSKVLIMSPEELWMLIGVALVVLVLSLTVGVLLTYRNAQKRGHRFWDNSSKRMLLNMAIPLAAGGVFCLVLMHHRIYGLLVPATLIFYGLSLINGGKFTLSEITYLGIMEVVLGILAAFYIGYGFLFWAVGFGVLHIIYGIFMWYKYER